MEILASAIWVLIGGLTSHYARQRGRNPITWFLLGLFFGIFGLLALFLMPVIEENQSAQSTVANTQKFIEPPPMEPDVTTMQWYYSDKDYQTQGPVSYQDLMTLWNMYDLTADSYVWSEGMSDWKRFGDVFKKNEK